MMAKPSMGKVTVLKLSGSLFFSEHLRKVVGTLKSVTAERKNLKLVIICGGGSNARNYIELARQYGADQITMDEIGIDVSRLNARILVSALGRLAVNTVPSTLTELAKAAEVSFQQGKIVVMGGLHPGQSTNAVGALVAEKLQAEIFVNATDVDAVYDKDPKKFSAARRLATVSTKELSRILESESMQAGAYDLMDPVALKLIQRSKIQTWITRCNSDTIRDFLTGKKKKGTRIIFNK